MNQAMNAELIFCHLERKRAYADAAGSQEYIPANFIAGEVRRFALRFLAGTPGGGVFETFPNVKSLTAVVGLLDARPTGGTVAYQFGSGASTAQNTTADLPWNHNAAALAAAINAVPQLVSAYGAATVQAVPGGFAIYFAAAAGAIPIQARRNRLTPLTVVRAWAVEVAGGWVHEIRLVQAPLTSETAWVRQLPPAPSIEEVQAGGLDNSGQFPTPEIQRLNMPPLFRGSYYLRRPDNLARTILLDRNDDPETTVRDAIAAIYGDDSDISVKLFENYAHITFSGGNLDGTDIPELEVVVADAPPGDVTLSLDFRRAAVWAALREEQSTAVYFEIRAHLDTPDAAPETPGEPLVLFRTQTQILVDGAYDGGEVAQDPPWLRPPNPVDYTPTTPDQIQSGIAWWLGVKGNGTAKSIACDHGMDTQDIASVTVYDNATGVERPPLSYTVTNANTVTLDYDTAPALASLRVIIAGAVPVSQWEPHTHTQAQIIGLVDSLDNLGSRLEDLEEIIVPGVAVAPKAESVGMDVLIPEVREVIGFRGTEAEAEALWGEMGEMGVKASLLNARRAPVLLPAVHDSTVTDPLPTPLPAAAAGSVWKANRVEVIPGFGGVRGLKSSVNGFVASDGRGLWVAARGGTSNSYYAAAFERGLFALAVSPEMLAIGRTLEILWGVQGQLVHGSCDAQWVMSLQLGTFSAETTPDPLDLNLQAVTWGTPVFSQALTLTKMAQSHFFGLRIKRNAAAFLLDQQKYGNWTPNNAAAPASALFAVRARLERFDTENVADPRGYVAWQLIGSLDMGEEGKMTTKPAKGRIF